MNYDGYFFGGKFFLVRFDITFWDRIICTDFWQFLDFFTIGLFIYQKFR